MYTYEKSEIYPVGQPPIYAVDVCEDGQVISSEAFETWEERDTYLASVKQSPRDMVLRAIDHLIHGNIDPALDILCGLEFRISEEEKKS